MKSDSLSKIQLKEKRYGLKINVHCVYSGVGSNAEWKSHEICIYFFKALLKIKSININVLLVVRNCGQHLVILIYQFSDTRNTK